MFITLCVCFIFGILVFSFVTSSFHIKFPIIGSVFVFGTIILLLLSNYSFSNEKTTLENQQEKSSIESLIPPPTILPESGNWVPSVNQYFLVPMQGKLYVYYVGTFSNPFHAKGTKLQLPLPKGSYEFHFNVKNNKETFSKSHFEKDLVLDFPLDDGVNQITGEFSIDSFYGKVHFGKNDLTTLSGMTLVVMPEYDGIIRKIIGNHFQSMNIWPARIVNVPSDFKSRLEITPVHEKSKSHVPSSNVPSRQLIRFGNESSAFPEFDVVGIVPERTPLVTLSVLFAIMLALTSSLFIIKNKK